jgi:hypothetical protein
MFRKLIAKMAPISAKSVPEFALAAPFDIPDAAQDEIFCAQPPHIRVFLAVLHRIAGDVRLVSEILQSGASLPKLEGPVGSVPIYCKDIEALFERIGPDGRKTYVTYSYTQDLKSMDPNAQVHLSNFFGRIVALNTMLTSRDPALTPAKAASMQAMLDRIYLEALFFKSFFSAYDLSQRLLINKVHPQEAQRALEALINRTKADYAEANDYLIDCDQAFARLPMTSQPLIVEVAKPHEAGQVVVNGVYFDCAMGKKMIAHAARSGSQVRSA